MVVESIATVMSIQSWNRLWLSINALKECTSIVAIRSCHEVSSVLGGPVGGAGQFGRYHQHCVSGGGVAHCTGNVVGFTL